MQIVSVIRKSLSAKVALMLAAVLLVLTAGAAVLITNHQTHQLEELTLEKARLAAGLGARYYGEALDKAIDGGSITVADAFDRNYVPIKGFDFGDQPKFHTRYDFVTDSAVLRFQDRFMADPDFSYAFGVDENGYIPTHASVFQKALTGDPAKDRLDNRTKHMANNPLGLAAARSLEPSLVQPFALETGEKIWDVSAPVFVKAKHWGAFRIAVSRQQIAAHQHDLVLVLAGLFAGFLAVTVGTLFLVVRRAMGPVVALTAAAEQISMGDGLEEPLRPRTVDEIGQLTKAVDRLRISMKAAMSRLGQ